MEPTSTLWALDSHTLGKHLVLREYLNAWLPIMGMSQGRILFIDGFAGPGSYSGGEDGSPIIALNCLKEHSSQDKISAEVGFIFVEKDPSRANFLQKQVTETVGEISCNCWAEVITGTFDETLSRVLDELDEQSQHLAPSFLMIDPFGISGTPMNVISRILKNPRSEIYASFMYEAINRFKATPEFAPHLDALFGTDEWKTGLGITNPRDRKTFYYDLYEAQLKKAGADQVVRFELYEKNRLVYAIFFGTKHVKGSNEIKRAIWKVAPWGDFAFHGSRSPQLSLGIEAPDYEPLKQSLIQQYRNKGWVTIDDVEKFVMSDRTDYYKSQLRKNVLNPLESNQEILIDETTRKRRNSYPKGTRILFI